MPLNMVVCIKWVPNTQVVNIDPVTGTLIREGVPSIINPHDLNAVEMALGLKERYGGTVTALSMAPMSARAGLEFVIGMGVDRAVLLSDRVFAGADTLATSYTISKALERMRPFDIVFFGHETIDSSTAHMGAQTASWLGLPYLYYVFDVEYVDGVVRAKRRLEKRVEVYELPTPCILAVAMKSNKPRPVKLSHKLRARMEKVIDVWTNNELGLRRECIGLKGSPTAVEKVLATPSVPRKKQKYDGVDVREAARWLVDRLIEEGLKIA